MVEAKFRFFKSESKPELSGVLIALTIFFLHPTHIKTGRHSLRGWAYNAFDQVFCSLECGNFSPDLVHILSRKVGDRW